MISSATAALSSMCLVLFAGLTACAGSADSAPAAANDQGALSSCAAEAAGTATPRQSMQPTPLPSVQEKIDAWKTAFDAYQQVASVYSAEAAAHAAAYGAAAGDVPGRACTSDAECSTNSASFPGHCRIYYDRGQCIVDDPSPLPDGPVAPPQPALSCADFACIAGFQCEQERSTGGVACVEARPSGGCGGENGGGGGGRGRGRHWARSR